MKMGMWIRGGRYMVRYGERDCWEEIVETSFLACWASISVLSKRRKRKEEEETKLVPQTPSDNSHTPPPSPSTPSSNPTSTSPAPPSQAAIQLPETSELSLFAKQ